MSATIMITRPQLLVPITRYMVTQQWRKDGSCVSTRVHVVPAHFDASLIHDMWEQPVSHLDFQHIDDWYCTEPEKMTTIHMITGNVITYVVESVDEIRRMIRLAQSGHLTEREEDGE